MFGYIGVYKPELKVKDFEIYNAIYCGLCRHMGRNYGVFSKFCLSYDMAFFALLQSALEPTVNCYSQKRCRVNPLKKCTYCENDESFQDLAAAAGVALSDMKVLDNISDSTFFKAVFCRFLRLFTKRWASKAYKNYPELKDIICEYASGQKRVEKIENCSLDQAAEPTARAVSRIASMLRCEEKYKFVLERMGYCLGKWVYLCDVADDIEKDIKTNSFNPLKFEDFGNQSPKEYAEKRLTPILNTCFTECATYSELLEIKKHKAILDNIFYEGLKERQKQIFSKEKAK